MERLPFQLGSKWMILKTMINLKGEGGWLCFPCRTQQALSNGKNLRGSVHLFFFQGGECPGVSILSEYFQRRHIIICSFPTAPRSAFKSPWSIWLAYTGGFIQCLHWMFCGFPDAMGKLRQEKEIGNAVFSFVAEGELALGYRKSFIMVRFNPNHSV